MYAQGDNIQIYPYQLINKKMKWFKFDLKEPATKRKIIEELIDNKMIYLCHSGVLQGEKNMDKFMAQHDTSFHLVDLNRDGIPELVFNGFDCNDTKNEFLYIYAKRDGKYQTIYTKKGNIIGYRSNPHTGEILLIHFNYPCCKNGTNNLNTLRFTNGRIIEFRKEFFAGRKDLMKGPFLPEKIDPNGETITASKEIKLRWSPAIIDTLAWTGVFQKNIIIAYPEGAKFRVLANQQNDKGENWLFVISKSSPIQNQRYIVEPTNFVDTKVYGWIKDGDY